MSSMRKHPIALWGGGLVFLAGSLTFGGIQAASAVGSSQPVTANQGAAGTSAWPVKGTVTVNGSVGVNNFPATQSVSGTVGLDTTDSNHLGNIDSATSNLHFDGAGSLKISPQGTVQTQAAVPGTQFSAPAVQSGETVGGPTNAGTTYAITSLVVSNQGAQAEAGTLSIQQGCTTASQLADQSGPVIEVPAGGTIDVSFPQPFILTNTVNGDCLMFWNIPTNSSTDLFANVVGYTY